MQLEQLAPKLPNLPPPTGAHRLAWSYLLDTVFADAYHAGVQLLRVALPPTFEVGLAARTGFDTHPEPRYPGSPTTASFGLAEPRESDLRSYRLRFGLLAPASLRRQARSAAPPTGPFELRGNLYVYTLRARLFGVPMRLFNMLGRPLAADRALLGLRQTFASEYPTPCYYILETWSRPNS